MDFETAEHIILPVITAVIGALVAWLKMRSDAQAVQIDKWEAQRDDRREDFDALAKQQAATIDRLDGRVKEQDVKIENLERKLEEKDKLLDSLRTDVGTLKLIYRLMRRTVLTECSQGTECPLWRYLDDKERDEMVASLTAAPDRRE